MLYLVGVDCVHCHKDPALVEGFQFISLPFLQGRKCSAHLQHVVLSLISNSLSGSYSVAAVSLYTCVLPTQLEFKCIIWNKKLQEMHFTILGPFYYSSQWCGSIISVSATFGTSFFSICWIYTCMACIQHIYVQYICVSVRQLTKCPVSVHCWKV